jgi:hypothetical protein
VASDHPLRSIREMANLALDAVSAAFSPLYVPVGRPSIAPKILETDLLFRWFVGLG